MLGDVWERLVVYQGRLQDLKSKPQFLPEGIESSQCVMTLITLMRVLHYNCLILLVWVCGGSFSPVSFKPVVDESE